MFFFFFFQAEDGIRDGHVTGVQTCALPIFDDRDNLQTLANAYLAVDNSLEIIPVINKIDLPSAQPEEARRQIQDIVGLDGAGAILASAKTGVGVPEILEAVVARLPPPAGVQNAPLKALIFDSWFDS